MAQSQSFLQKLIRALGMVLLCTVILFGGCSYYFFYYPVNVAEKAAGSLVVGLSILDIFENDSVFMQQLKKSRFQSIHFGKQRIDDPTPDP